nr:TetR/AcrR family transcriptional regulator [Roseococcus sp. SDR]
MEAATTVFTRDGYAAASMDKVAQEAGMSKRTLYRLYPSKAALFEAAIQDSLVPAQLDLELAPETDLRTGLAVMLEAAGRHLLALRRTGIFRLVIAEQGRSPELAESFHRVLVRRGSTALQRLIAAEMERGRLRRGDADAVGRMLYGMAFGSVQIRLLLGLRLVPPPEEIAGLARAAVEVFLDGMRPEVNARRLSVAAS